MIRTGVYRKIDELGRVVIPRELMLSLDIKHKTPLHFLLDPEKKMIGLSRHIGIACIFCDDATPTELKIHKGKWICNGCLQEMATKSPKVQVTSTEIPSKQGKYQNRREERIKQLQAIVKENPKMTQKEIGQLMGLSQASISNLIRSL